MIKGSASSSGIKGNSTRSTFESGVSLKKGISFNAVAFVSDADFDLISVFSPLKKSNLARKTKVPVSAMTKTGIRSHLPVTT